MAMEFDALVICANPLLNLVHAGDYTPGAVNRVAALTVAAEGKGVNVARVLARHGHRVAVTGFAGGHSGAWLRDLVAAEGVRDAFVETAAPLRVGFMASSPAAEHPTTVFPGGFRVTEAECLALLRLVSDCLDSARLVIASGSVPDRPADGLYAQLLSLCARHGVSCWLDAYGPPLRQALQGAVPPALSTPNRDEFEMGLSWNRVAELHITDGGGAVAVRQGQSHWRVLPPAIRQVNPVGSGDCYLAGLAHGWLRGMTFEDRLRYASAAGAANALRQDVAMIEPGDVDPLTDKVAVQRL
jgi:fructose-1-phosphate kinase PfkB-like protein